MLRITRDTNDESVSTLRLEGKLTGPWVTELARSCDRLARLSGLRLDLSSVTFADGAGVALLRDLLGRGAVLAGCSGLVRELLREEGR